MPAPRPSVRPGPASRRRAPRIVAALAGILVTALAVTGCSLPGASGTGGSDDGGGVDTTPSAVSTSPPTPGT
ncbi:hypothetical protein KDY119_03315 [Luteimicrobium xylanilyticum]|uniref:Uncharacterized protein n=1 Tax=Luteimicrobium xylanilyticum TaxID=1133546 RepID=A0A5P9QES8_9MICO|nr:hypothetical protein [Luteimicrobium xylanilyticum]QFU99779.1 hypothetical protein KDY119_03315 [Luteimicrobium xylanilyticum]